MKRIVRNPILALAAWGLLAGAQPARAQGPAPAPGFTPPSQAPPYASYYTPPPPPLAPSPYVTYYGPQYVAPVRYSFYAPTVVVFPPPVAPSGTSTSYYLGYPRHQVYYGTTTQNSPYANYTPVYGSAYYTPLFFR